MRGFDNYCKRGFPRGDKRVKRGSPWGELAPEGRLRGDCSL